jgi:hypothetical protein
MPASFSLLLVAGAMLAGCATTPATPLGARLVAERSGSLRLLSLRAERRADDVVVRGRVSRRTMMTGAVRGHLHIEALKGTTVLAWQDAQWSRLARRRLPTSSFQAELPLAASRADEIRVSHMLTKHDAPSVQEIQND